MAAVKVTGGNTGTEGVKTETNERLGLRRHQSVWLQRPPLMDC